MTVLLLVGMIFSFVTLALLVAFFITGAKNQTLRYLAGGFGIVAGLLWLIRTLMR